ncbi:hypothetical protein [Actinomadura livida]|uniref:PH domain-containing protein n=1 Tax=Actinomadura livida TaxID=79909 RepID=A0A7W7MYI0_9ACTN|nr:MULTISPECIES: hypothetical protein [Actinomadura]MBB4774860.1 hypothetical protein [Actinomadura catellatispora]GGU05553.1 hypothetical protein GCM10010208_32130 [Actinomadura livida]
MAAPEPGEAGSSFRPAAGYSLRYQAALPGGLTMLLSVLITGALAALTLPAMYAGLPTFVVILVVPLISGCLSNAFARSVTLTPDGHLLVSGFGQRLDIEAHRINAITVSRRGRLGFGTAMVHHDGGKFRIWQAMRHTPVPRSKWSLRYVSGHGGKDFGDLVYRLHTHNPAMVIKGVTPPPWAHPHTTPQPTQHWY